MLSAHSIPCCFLQSRVHHEDWFLPHPVGWRSCIRGSDGKGIYPVAFTTRILILIIMIVMIIMTIIITIIIMIITIIIIITILLLIMIL